MEQDKRLTAGKTAKQKKSILILLVLFMVSRIIANIMGLEFQFDALFKYWQYLDVNTLENNLAAGVWFDHTQPPMFNLLLGTILKIFGMKYMPVVLSIALKMISLFNAILLLKLAFRLTRNNFVSLLVAAIYLLSPATMVFENELFYTSFITLLFLIAVSGILNLLDTITWKHILSVFLPLTLICLTRSMYHLTFLLAISGLVVIMLRAREHAWKIVLAASLSIVIVGSWYFKNYLIFNKFSTSSWMGMNMARNVFHDVNNADSTKISSREPFLPISEYTRYIKEDLTQQYKGLNDRDLLMEYKNDSLKNLKHINYLPVSDQYQQESLHHIKQNPFHFLKNIAQSAIIFFTPATRYSVTEKQARKIKYYDLLYSFNLSHFAEGKMQRRIALTVSAIPKFLFYVVILFLSFRQFRKEESNRLLYLFIFATMGYVFIISSIFEHYENMRFRYELEPLFLLLAATATARLAKIYGWKLPK